MSDRTAQLTVVEGGIDRQRTKAGARADTLFDFINGYRTKGRTAKVRPGTRRVYSLPAGTVGLKAFDGCLHVFSSSPVVVGSPVYAITPDTSGGFVLWNNTSIGSISPSDDLPHAVTLVAAIFTTADNRFQLEFDQDISGIFTSFGIEHEDGTQIVQVADATEELTPTYGAYAIFWTLDGDWLEGNGSSIEGVYEIQVDPDQLCIESHVLLHPADINATLTKVHFVEPFLGALYVVGEFDDGSIHHYWLQTGEEWEADTEYSYHELVVPTTVNGYVYRATRYGNGYQKWVAGVLRTIGNGSSIEASIIEPTVYNEYYYTAVEVGGDNPRSGQVEPLWPTNTGEQIVENTDGYINPGAGAANPPDPPDNNAPQGGTTERYE